MGKSVIKEIKKQIDRQTREKVGNVRIDTAASQFVDQPGRDLPIVTDPPPIVWDKTAYHRNRGTYFDLNPSTFPDVLAQKSRTQVFTQRGEFSETSSAAYQNTRYSGYAGIMGGGALTLRIVAAGCSVSIWADGIEVYASGSTGSFLSTDLSIPISERTLIQIFWYTADANNVFTMSGDPAFGLDLWEQSDTSPFALTVQWSPVNPIESGTVLFGGLSAYVTLRWWFGNFRYEYAHPDAGEWELPAYPLQGLGGFGIYHVEFVEVGLFTLTDADQIGGWDSASIAGNFSAVRWIKIGATIYVPTYVAYDSARNRTYFYLTTEQITSITVNFSFPEDGLISGPLLIASPVHVADIPYDPSMGSTTDAIFSTTDMAVEHGKQYYYLIDTYDDSPMKNRGGMTTEMRWTTSGDEIAPLFPTSLSVTRVSYSAVAVEFTPSSSWDVWIHTVWEDNTDPYRGTVTSGGATYLFTDDTAEDSREQKPYRIMTGDVIRITHGGIKYVRKITSKEGTRINFDTSLPFTPSNGDVIRKLKPIATWRQGVTGEIRHPDRYLGDI